MSKKLLIGLLIAQTAFSFYLYARMEQKQNPSPPAATTIETPVYYQSVDMVDLEDRVQAAEEMAENAQYRVDQVESEAIAFGEMGSGE